MPQGWMAAGPVDPPRQTMMTEREYAKKLETFKNDSVLERVNNEKINHEVERLQFAMKRLKYPDDPPEDQIEQYHMIRRRTEVLVQKNEASKKETERLSMAFSELKGARVVKDDKTSSSEDTRSGNGRVVNGG